MLGFLLRARPCARIVANFAEVQMTSASPASVPAPEASGFVRAGGGVKGVNPPVARRPGPAAVAVTTADGAAASATFLFSTSALVAPARFVA